jgi:hypothetical protein
MYKNALYLTYDGLNDPLGKSQIVPYLKLISKNVSRLHIISFEKKHNYKKKMFIRENITLHKLNFTSNFGKIGKLWDMLIFFFTAILIIKKNNISIIHARSHLSAYISFFLKKIYRINYIFDFRGLWLEERLESNSWPNNFFYRFLFNILKFFEKKVISESKFIIVLTQKFKIELGYLHNVMEKVFVIPCVNNFNPLKPKMNKIEKNIFKKKLGFPTKNIIFCYSGSMGGIYKIETILDNFVYIKKHYSKSSFLVLTNNYKVINQALKKTKFFSIKQAIKIHTVDWHDLSRYLSIVDIGISFIENGYARIAQSPTRISEFLSMGIPVITNEKIGDTDFILKKINGGFLVRKKNYKFNIIKNIENLLSINSLQLKIKSNYFFSYKVADKKYSLMYKELS